MMKYKRKKNKNSKQVEPSVEIKETNLPAEEVPETNLPVDEEPAEPEQSFLTSSDDDSDQEVTIFDTEGDKRFLMLTKQLESLQSEVKRLKTKKKRQTARPKRYYVKRDDEITRAMRHKIINL